MTRAELGTRIRAIISDHLQQTYLGERGAKEVTDASLLIDDLQLDSLDLVEITMAVEDEFDIELNDEELSHLTKVEHVIAYVAGILDIQDADAA